MSGKSLRESRSHEIIGTTELTLDSSLNQPQRESLLHIQSLARSLLSNIDDISKSEHNFPFLSQDLDPTYFSLSVEAGPLC